MKKYRIITDGKNYYIQRRFSITPFWSDVQKYIKHECIPCPISCSSLIEAQEEIKKIIKQEKNTWLTCQYK